jgi:hypothetical protein
MTHNALKSYADRHITPVNDAYLFVTVYGKYKGIKEDDLVLIERESKVFKYKVHSIQYFSPHSDEFFGKLLLFGLE